MHSVFEVIVTLPENHNLSGFEGKDHIGLFFTTDLVARMWIEAFRQMILDEHKAKFSFTVRERHVLNKHDAMAAFLSVVNDLPDKC